MKRSLHTLLACLLIGLSSCLEITEKVHMREGGSGQFTFTVDMNEAKPLLDMMNSFSKDADSDEVSGDLKAGMEDARERLKSVKGIHHPTLIRSESGLLSGITFEFDDIEALNKAMNVVQNNKPDEQERFFSRDGRQLHRLNTLKLENEIKNETSGDFGGIDMTVNGKSVKELMKDMVYRTEYTFDQPVKSISNSSATLSADKRKITLERYLLDDNRKASTLENVIRF